MGKHDVSYYRCTCCGFVQTEAPHWLDEAYSEAINFSDIGLLGRNVRLSRIVKVLICAFFNPDNSFLDFGGGYGMLVRLMRDQGFDFFRYDKYCQNLFANGFDLSDITDGEFELVTAFEFFEHIHDPVTEVERLLNLSPNIFFTTELLPGSSPQPGSWWYYGTEHGQHISFYTLESLQALAERFSLNLYTARGCFHLLTSKDISPRRYRWLFKKKITAIIDAFCKRKSLRYDDYRKLTGISIK